ncbi:MAG: hypothetical protein Q7S06_03120 [Nanoarchaeota archaeon]|nr:hypothetical protein [Nanoarchaeota archaeon]
MDKVLEKRADLWCDNSPYTSGLRKRLTDKGFTLKIHTSGVDTPVLDYQGRFYQGGEIETLAQNS